ncbi:hypothetical protein [Flaviaesturariibacter amylovorans]|uniref:TonB-dependent receptor n=1 Tax=Flaviaesturariibacter amylovorans TaxID=1084520 RepID=A0ABP8GBZ9_9BACT
MQMTGRRFAVDRSYRYGFNGQEKSDEVDNFGSSMAAEFWQYDSRLGKRWNIDPRPVGGTSPYSTFMGNPIAFSDQRGDTSITAAGGTMKAEIDDKSHKLEFYQPNSTYTVTGSQTRIPTQAGELRSFTNGLGRFSARWKTNTDGSVAFNGYLNDDGETFEEALSSFTSSWKYKLYQFGSFMETERNKDPLAFDLKVSFTMISLSMMADAERVPFSFGYNPSVTTSEAASALGTLRFVSKGENIALGLGHTLDDFSNATGALNYRQFSSGFRPNDILLKIANPSNNLHFNLQDFTRWKYIKYAANPVSPNPALRNVTNWELYKIYNIPGALDRTTFYKFVDNTYQVVNKPF